MALQVWLPLTKDLRNQGLSNVTVTNNGATYSSTGGKLGGCYNFTTTSWQRITFPYSLANKSEFSVCLWIKIPGTTITGFPFGFCHSGDYWQFITYNNSVGIRDNASGSTGTRKDYSLGSFVANQWTHLAFTYNAGTLKTYKDGVLFSTNSTGGTAMNDYTIAGSGLGEPITNSSSYYFNGSINDFRVYDHCLSPMEVKQISQGLVLHYPLNRQGFGQENLLKGTDTLAITGNINTGVGGWDNISTLTETADGIKLTGRSGSPCFGIPLAIPGSINNNEPYTLSFKYRTNKAVGCTFYYIESSGSNISIYNSAATKISTTEWQNYTWTITNSTVADRTPRAILLFYAFSSSSSDWIEIKRGSVKLEKGSITTPWCPNSSDALATTMGLNGTTEYDTSGYCGNGTRIGTFSWTSDTPKYLVSTTFSGSQYILADSPSSEGATLALWVKTTSISNGAIAVDYKSKLGFGFYGGVIIPSCNSAIKTTYPITNYNINQWNHIVVVRNNSSSIQLYINGVLQTAASNQDYWSGGVIDGLSVAARPNGSNPISCQVSDLRIYATALSASDVKSLYQNCATIDPDGTIHGQIR